MFAAMLATYRRALDTGDFVLMAQARQLVAAALHPYLAASWEGVREVARRSPHCFSSEYYAHSGAVDELLADPDQREHLGLFMGLSPDDACVLYRAWSGEQIKGMSNYAGD